MSNDQVIQLTYRDLKRLVKEMQAPAVRWMEASKFAEMHDISDDSMKYMRSVNPTMFKLNERKTRWLIDTKEYYKKSS